MTRVYICCSPSDAAFAEGLRHDLTYADVEALIGTDCEGWKPRAVEHGADAAAMIVLLSPDSVVSERCGWEVEEARRCGMPLFPVICRPLPTDDIPDSFLRPRVYVYADTEDGLKGNRWGWEYQALKRHLLDAIAWEAERTRIGALAAAWHDDGRADARLLDETSCRAAKSWASRRPTNAEPLDERVLQFLAASRIRLRDTTAGTLHRRLVQRGFISPARAALEAGGSAAALRLMAAGAILSGDPSLSLDADADEAHRFALWRAALRAVQHIPDAVLRHDKPLTACAFSPDGSRILTASEDRTARVWTRNAREEAVLSHGDVVDGVTFTAGGSLAVTSCRDHTVRVWAVPTGAPRSILRLTGNERGGVVFSRDGERAISACEGYTARVWDVLGAREIAVLTGHGQDIEDVAFSPDGTRALTASREHVAVLWNAATGEDLVVFRGHERPVTAIAFSQDARRVLGGSWTATSRLWDAATGEELAVLAGPVDAYVQSVAFSPDGTRAITHFANGRGICVWDLAAASHWPLPDKQWTHAAFSHDGQRLLTSSTEGAIQLWDLRTGAEVSGVGERDRSVAGLAFSHDGRSALIRSGETAYLTDLHCSAAISTLTGHSSEVTSIAISSDGTRVATGSNDRTARLWRADTGETIAILEAGSGVAGLAFDRDAAQVLTASTDGSLHVWDGLTGAAIGRIPGAGGDVTCVAFSHDGVRRLAGFADGTIVLLDNASGVEVLRLRAHDERVTCVAFNATGTAAISGAFRCGARIWDLVSGQMARELSPSAHSVELSVWSAAFCPTGTRVITSYASRYAHGPIDMFGGEDVARVWDIATGRQVAVLQGHTRPVASVAFGPGGACALTGSADGTARLWDAATGAELAMLDAKGSYMVSNAISADGTRAAAAWRGNTVRVWDVSRWTAFDGDRAVFLTAALDCGVGRRSNRERDDVLMSEAPDDLYAAMMGLLSPERRARVQDVSRRLRTPFHPRCYSPA